jgi:hypothetical protein
MYIINMVLNYVFFHIELFSVYLLELGHSCMHCMHSFIKVGSYTVYSLHGHVIVVNHLASIVICYCFSTFSAKRCLLGRDKQKSIKVSIELVQMLEL